MVSFSFNFFLKWQGTFGFLYIMLLKVLNTEDRIKNFFLFKTFLFAICFINLVAIKRFMKIISDIDLLIIRYKVVWLFTLEKHLYKPETPTHLIQYIYANIHQSFQ